MEDIHPEPPMSSQQHLAPSTSSAQQTPASATSSAGPVVAPQPQGNQAALEDAGLAGRASDSGGMKGALEMAAGVVLDAMPLSLAVPLAAQFVDIEAVQGWLDEQSLPEVAAAIQGRFASLVDALWPVGAGLQGEMALGGGLVGDADVLANVELLRVGPAQARYRYQAALEVGAGPGASAEYGDAFGETGLDIGASSEASLNVQVDGGVTADFDLCQLLAERLVRSTGSLSAILRGLGQLLHTDDLFDRTVPVELWSPDCNVRVGAEAEAKAGAQVDIERLPMGTLRSLAGAALGVEGQDATPPEFAAVARLAVSLGASLEVGTAGAALRVAATTENVAALDASLPALRGLPAWAQIEASLGDAEAQEGAELRIQLLPSADGARPVGVFLSSSSTRELDGAEGTQTDTLTTVLGEGASERELYAMTPDQKLARFLSMPGLRMERKTELEVDDEELERCFPGWLGRLVDPGTQGALSAGVPAMDVQVSLVGSLIADGAVFSALAQARIALPVGLHEREAAQEIGRSLFALSAGGEVTASWLAPHRAALLAAARQVTMTGARLKGRARVGGGCKAATDLGAGAEVEARMAAGVIVDRELNAEEAARLRQAAA